MLKISLNHSCRDRDGKPVSESNRRYNVTHAPLTTSRVGREDLLVHQQGCTIEHLLGSISSKEYLPPTI